MERHGLYPSGDNLRKAVRWLSEQHRLDSKAIQEASFRFDLSPLDEQFLLTEFRRPHEPNEDL